MLPTGDVYCRQVLIVQALACRRLRAGVIIGSKQGSSTLAFPPGIAGTLEGGDVLGLADSALL